MAKGKGDNKGVLEGLKGLIGMSPGKTAAKDAGGDRKLFRKTQNSVVTKFDTAAMKQLKGMVTKPDPTGKPGAIPKEQPSWLKKLMGPAFLILAGIAAFVGSLLTSGPLKGLMGMMGKLSVKTGLLMMVKAIGKTLKPVLKFIPLIGSLMSFGIAYTRFKEGKYVQGAIDVVSGLLGIFGAANPAMLALSLGLDVLNALLDVGQHFKVANMGGFGAGRMIFQLVLKALRPYSKTLKLIPFVGSLIGFGAAYLRYKEGQIIRGTIDLVGAIAGIFPGIGTGIMWGAMVLNAILDFGGSAKGKEVTGGKNLGFFAMILKLIAKFAKFLKFIPFLGSIIGLGIAYMYFKGGKPIQGALELVGAIAGLFPGIGTAVMWGLSVLNLLLDAAGVGAKDEKKKAEPSLLAKIGSFVWGIIKTIPPFSTFIHGYKGIKALFKGDLKKAAIHFMYAIPVIGTLLHWIMGPAEEQLEGADIPGSKGDLWNTVLDILFKIPPISNFVNLYKGIKNLFDGNFSVAAAHFLFAIPLVGNLLEWFGGDAIMEEAEKPPGERSGLWTIVKDYILAMPPFSNVYHLGKGIFALFSGEWSAAGEHFLQAIPFIGNIISFLAGDAGEGETDEGKPQGSIFKRLKEGVIKKFKGAWAYMPGWAKWAARKVLPDEFVRQLDNPSPEYHDAQDLPIEGSKQPEPPKRDAAAETKKSLLRQYGKVWKTLPTWMKWIAKTVLPREVYAALQSGDVGDVEDLAAGSGQGGQLKKATQTIDKATQNWITFGNQLLNSTQKFIRALTRAMGRAIGALGKVFASRMFGGGIFGRAKMPIAESWQRRATPETSIRTTSNQPMAVKVIGKVELDSGDRSTRGLEGLVTYNRDMNEKLFPSLLTELREGAIVQKLDEINESVKANKPIPNFLGGGGQPGPINNLRDMQRPVIPV